MPRRAWTISLMRATGTSRSRASLFWVRPCGRMNSSSKISPGAIGSSFSIGALTFFDTASVVVDDLHILGTIVPAKTDSPLVIDADAVLAHPVAPEGLEPISRRTSQILQPCG